MKVMGLKWSATLVISAAMLLMSTSVGNAGLIPWVWNGIFGPHCPKTQCCPSPCSTYSAPSPCGPGGCGVQSAYFAPSSCSPCGTSACGTSMCGVSGCDYGACGPAGCPSGQCGVPIPATNNRTVEPSPPPANKTYEDPPAASEGDPAWNPTDDSNATPPNPGAEEVEAHRLPLEPVPGKNGAIETPPINEGEDAPGGDAEKEGADSGPDLLNDYLEDKQLSWRPMAGRKRLKLQPTYAKAQVIRKPKYAKGEWKVVPTPANVAKR